MVQTSVETDISPSTNSTVHMENIMKKSVADKIAHILPGIISIILKEFNVMKPIASSIDTSNSVTISTITGEGVSDKYYQHCTTFPIYGSGQGATNSLGIWLTITSTIRETYEQSANGDEFISPDNAITLVLAILGFMDDVTNQVNEFTDNQ
eukprot:14378333-Ditylum_brightwellii.AAC.1